MNRCTPDQTSGTYCSSLPVTGTMIARCVLGETRLLFQIVPLLLKQQERPPPHLVFYAQVRI